MELALFIIIYTIALVALRLEAIYATNKLGWNEDITPEAMRIFSVLPFINIIMASFFVLYFFVNWVEKQITKS